MAQLIWVKTEQGIRGPFPLDRLRRDASTGVLKPNQKVSTDRQRWFPAAQIEGLDFPKSQRAEQRPGVDEDDVLSWLGEAEPASPVDNTVADAATPADAAVIPTAATAQAAAGDSNSWEPVDAGQRAADDKARASPGETPAGGTDGPGVAVASPSKVRTPAIFLMVAAALTLLVQLPEFCLRTTRMVVFVLDGVPPEISVERGGPGSPRMVPRIPPPNLFGLVSSTLIILGARRMLKFKGYRFVMCAAVLALVPTSCFFLLTVPFGIWTLIVLLNPGVKMLFTLRRSPCADESGRARPDLVLRDSVSVASPASGPSWLWLAGGVGALVIFVAAVGLSYSVFRKRQLDAVPASGAAAGRSIDPNYNRIRAEFQAEIRAWEQAQLKARTAESTQTPSPPASPVVPGKFEPPKAGSEVPEIVARTGANVIFNKASGNKSRPASARVQIPDGVSVANGRISGEGHNQDRVGIPRNMEVKINGRVLKVISFLSQGETDSFDMPVPDSVLVSGWNDIQAYIEWSNDEYDRGHWVSLTLTLK